MAGYQVSKCVDNNAVCDNPLADAGLGYPARPVECEEGIDCAGNGVCCATGGTPAMDTTCGYFAESPSFTATTCEQSCSTGTFQLCGADSECSMGQHCTPFRASIGLQLGFCM
jgi:hypothetical protein